jgi:hypothetical protein
MCYCQFNIGDCCDEPFIAEVVLADNQENSMVRYALTATGTAGGTSNWSVNYSGTFGSDCIEGANYAPSFTGLGLAQIKSGTAMRFDITDGTNLSTFGATSAVPAGTGNVYQESNGYVIFVHGLTGSDRLFTLSSGEVVAEIGGSWTGTNCAVRAADGSIWRTVTGAACKLFGAGATVRSDLSTVAVTSTKAHGVVSTNGVDFYAVGYDGGGNNFELFHSDSSGTPTLLGGGTVVTAGSCGAFTKIGNYIFLSNTDTRIWRFHVPTSTLEVVLTRTAGAWGTWYGPGQHFFVPPV